MALRENLGWHLIIIRSAPLLENVKTVLDLASYSLLMQVATPPPSSFSHDELHLDRSTASQRDHPQYFRWARILNYVPCMRSNEPGSSKHCFRHSVFPNRDLMLVLTKTRAVILLDVTELRSTHQPHACVSLIRSIATKLRAKVMGLIRQNQSGLQFPSDNEFCCTWRKCMIIYFTPAWFPALYQTVHGAIGGAGRGIWNRSRKEDE